MRETRGGVWLLVLAASCAIFSVIFGGLAWWIFRGRAGVSNSDLVGIVGAAVALGGAIGALFGQPLFGQWLTERRALPRFAVPGDLTALEDADRLAKALREQWTQAAAERGLLAPSPIPIRWRRASLEVAGPLSSAIGSKAKPARFPPLPGIARTTAVRLRAGRLEDLHAVYGGLDSGRLLIVGHPGSGKTSAGVLLVLAALAHREQTPAEERSRVPVPVMLSLEGWDPLHERFEQWFIARLAETYPLFRGRRGAAKLVALLAAGNLAVILDGLDETADRLRAPALRALSQQVRVRLVLLTRSAEMVAAAREAHLLDAAAVELEPVEAGIAADYLVRVQIAPAPPGWRDLLEALNDAPTGSVAKALSSPLSLTLLRDTYRAGDDVRELLGIAHRAGRAEVARQEVENHLLDRVLPAAYSPHLGVPPSPYDLATAQRVLRYVASRMNQREHRDLRWWRIAEWVPLAPRVVVTGLVVVTPFGLGTGLYGGSFRIAFVLPYAVAAGVIFGRGGGTPERSTRLRVRDLFRWQALAWAVGYGLVAGLIFSVAFSASAALTTALIGSLAMWLYGALTESISTTASPVSPLKSWRDDQKAAAIRLLCFGLALGLIYASSRGYRIAYAILLGAFVGLTFGVLRSETWAARLAFLQITFARRSPARLMRFLEDARQRGILRTVGPVYQFRHARLQDRLAERRVSQAGES
jgi:hypothetical protein